MHLLNLRGVFPLQNPKFRMTTLHHLSSLIFSGFLTYVICFCVSWCIYVFLEININMNINMALRTVLAVLKHKKVVKILLFC